MLHLAQRISQKVNQKLLELQTLDYETLLDQTMSLVSSNEAVRIRLAEQIQF